MILYKRINSQPMIVQYRFLKISMKLIRNIQILKMFPFRAEYNPHFLFKFCVPL